MGKIEWAQLYTTRYGAVGYGVKEAVVGFGVEERPVASLLTAASSFIIPPPSEACAVLR